MLSALRDFTATAQTFWGCDETDTGGILGVRINNVNDFTGDTLSAANGYTGLVTATGLSGDYTYQMLLSGNPVGSVYSFSTAPVAGDEFSILFLGDTATDVDEALAAIYGRESAALAFGSELYYLDDNSYGVIATDANAYNATASFPASYQAVRDSVRVAYRGAYSSETNRIVFMNKQPLFNSPGNHDLLAGNTAHAPGLCAYDGAHTALFDYPNNGQPTATGDIDSEPSTVLYFDKVIADVHVIVTDGLTYSNPFATGYLNGTSGNANNAGEDKQLAWLKSVVLSSTANVILINHSTVCRSSDLANMFAWLEINVTDKTVMFLTPDTHVSYCIYRDGTMSANPVMECGYSPSAGVTSSKTFYLPIGDVPYYADNLNEKTELTVATLATDTTIKVKDSVAFSAKGKIMFGNNVSQRGIDSIVDSTTISFGTTTVGAVYPIGTEVHSVDWPNSADIAGNTVQKRRANYGKITRFPNGHGYINNSHTRYQLIETFTGRIKFEFYILDSERMPRFYTSRSSFGITL